MTITQTEPKARATAADLHQDAEWYRDAVIYELHVRAFADSNGDGEGDFVGLTRKLDYLQELGVTVIWLLPFYESPQRDDGYDIADYRRIRSSFGTQRDFRAFMNAAHARGLRVITELVLNHTSEDHPWFQRARRAPKGSPEREYYVWSDTGEEFRHARIIFKDFERSNWTWDPVAGQYFWHRFYSHQPDLNFDSPRVREEMRSIVDFWAGQGVDGFRLDAVPYLFEREGTSCENLPETHAYLKELRAYIDARYPGRMLLAEANQWPEDAAAYFGDGDECHMAYHFPLMPRLFMAVRQEDRFPITDILEQTPQIPESSQWALFLRNHDELTLEMVTDEERDYMYRVFAADERARINLGIRRRLAPLLGHNRRLIELMNALLFSMPGTPVVYYGDEIGMGDNIYLGDRNGVRTPMQWSADRNAGFSAANPQRLYLPVNIDPEYHYEAVNVEQQQGNPSLLLWWMRRLIALRKRHKAFGRGSFSIVECDNRKVLAFVREHEGEQILVVANLSRFVQGASLDLSRFTSHVPVEMFGQTRFPPVGDSPYFLSLGPHTFYWFLLEPQATPVTAQPAEAGPPRPPLRASAGWETILQPQSRAAVDAVLAAYIPERRWFGGKARRTRAIAVTDVIPIRRRGRAVGAWLLVRVEYADGEPETYSLPVTAVSQEKAATVLRETPWAMIAPIEMPGGAEPLELVDALATAETQSALLEAFRTRISFATDGVSIAAVPQPGFRAPVADFDAHPPVILRGEQSNTSIAFGNAYVLKVFRRIEYGPHQQLEMQRFLAGTAAASIAPAIAGFYTLTNGRGAEATAAVLEPYITHQTDAWTYTLDELTRFLEDVAAERPAAPEAMRGAGPIDLAASEPPPELAERATGWLELAALLGRRTAELHVALASRRDIPAFVPESYTPFDQRALAQGLRTHARAALRLLRGNLRTLGEGEAALAQQVLAAETGILRRLDEVGRRPFGGERIRCHGDYHLGQVLFTGRDFAIIDFEGEPARSLGERRAKRSPLRDVAGMIRSLHYASRAGLHRLAETTGGALPIDSRLAEDWARTWYLWTSARFLGAYLEVAGPAGFLPATTDDIRFVLDTFVLDKALYEVAYELENRPEWAAIPLEGVLEIAGGLASA